MNTSHARRTSSVARISNSSHGVCSAVRLASCASYADARLPEFYKTVSAILDWSSEIFAFHATDRAANGRQEGLNNKIGVLKRVAYGFAAPQKPLGLLA